MSQKNKTEDKWREVMERAEAEERVENAIDDEHLLEEETAPEKNAEITALEKQVEAYRDQATRAKAELENVRKRAEQEVTKARKFAVERLLSELLPVVDSLVRGLEGIATDDSSLQSVRQGVELTLDMLHNTLEKNGVSAINPKPGDVFDPTAHEAMSIQQDSGEKHNTILQVLQKGYRLHDRVIRAAMVIVAA